MSSPSGSLVATFAAALSSATDWRKAVSEATDKITHQLAGTPTWACLFVSALWRNNLDLIAREVCASLGTGNLIGCTAESLVGTRCELEWAPGLSLWAACFTDPPDCFALEFATTPDGGTFLGWPDWWGDRVRQSGTVLILADPFSFPADHLLETLADEHPQLQATGGMASGGQAPGECLLIHGETVVERGAVLALLPQSIAVRLVVSQGCRPVGRPFVITKAERNIIYELGGRPALEQLYYTFDELPNHEQRLMQEALHVGRVVNEYQDQFGLGDFLVRNVIGADRRTGAIVAGDYFRTGQTVQFHIRDEHTADAELRELLSSIQPPPRAALLFTCNGRGTRLFSRPHHDAEARCGAVRRYPGGGVLCARGDRSDRPP
ncbi:MAG: hypothetical protein KatS3mg110_1593 [Pirellulaceae bacterium]|nr:MAG: hypothetical protein KatS3mg110_1593 [Pirellulaceae bacterium]